MRGAAKEEMFCGTFLLYILRMRRRRVHGFINVLSESFLYLPLWLIFRQPHPNFINVRTAYASEIWAQLTKNLLTKSGTERFRENIHLTEDLPPVGLPLLFSIFETFLLFLAIMHIVVAFLYVLDFKLKKPGNSVIAAMMVLVTAVMVCILFVE